MKKFLTYLAIMASVFVVVLLLWQLVFISTATVCGKVVYATNVKGKSIVYSYSYKGNTYKGSFLAKNGLCARIDCYDKNECIEVEVSTLMPFMSRLKEK